MYRQLPSEAKLFASVDKSWKDIMRRTEDRPNALRAAVAPGVLEILQTNNSNLEKIHKCLEVWDRDDVWFSSNFQNIVLTNLKYVADLLF